MNIKVFKIKFNNSQIGLNDEYDKLSDYEKEIVSELDCESFFDYQDYNDNYISYLICKPDELEKYSDILTRNLIIHSVSDLSENILKHKIDLIDELKPLLSTVNSIKLGFFMDDLSDWIIKNLDIDSVLDRIIEVGSVNKLTNTEKEFLKKFELP